MTVKEKKNNKTAQVKTVEPKVKATKVEVYVKKYFKNNWSNTKSVYTRPR